MSWLDNRLGESVAPLLDAAWILDIDTTVKPFCGKQEGAVVSYNPKKPGRPSHSYHTYLMAGLRLVLGVEVKAGNEHTGSHSLPGLLQVLDGLPPDRRPRIVRGDCCFGSDTLIRPLEERQQGYLFKLKLAKETRSNTSPGEGELKNGDKGSEYSSNGQATPKNPGYLFQGALLRGLSCSRVQAGRLNERDSLSLKEVRK